MIQYSDDLLKCFRLLNEVRENCLNKLFSAVDSFIFQDVELDKIIHAMPKWVCDAGINPEATCSRDDYVHWIKKAKHPIFGRVLYYYDLWAKISALQDRISAISFFLKQLYETVPSVVLHNEQDYISVVRNMGDRETNAHILINSVFVAMASSFDLLSKIAIEQNHYKVYNFSKYKGMKSNSSLFRYKATNVDDSLKTTNLLFSAPPIVRLVCAFRDEYVHNGPWDLRSSIYYTSIDGEPSDVIIYSPDIEESGTLTKSGSRNKFYSQGHRINIELPSMVCEVTLILQNTINRIAELYLQNISSTPDAAITEECIIAIKQFWEIEKDVIELEQNGINQKDITK